jgi:hypothetical protein
MPPSIAAQASQAAAQGQQQLANYNNQANQSKAQYGTYQGQADTANQNVADYTKGMQGAYNATTGNGNAGSAYNYGLNQQLGQLGYNPAEMTAARSNLNQSQGALSAYSDFANSGAAKFGLNAGGFAAANSGALSGLNNNIAANQGVVNGLSSLYGQAQTGANQFAGVTVQGEHETLAGLQNVYTNAANTRDQAATMMNFYNNLAQQQGGMNAQQQQAYATAQAQYAAAGQAAAQAALLVQQHQQQAKLFADQQAAATAQPVHNTGIGVIAPGHTGITNGNGSVIGVR